MTHPASSLSITEILNNANDKVLPVALGVDTADKPAVCDLAKYGNMLVCGWCGSGKSTLLDNIIFSLATRHTPDECEIVLIDTTSQGMDKWQYLPHMTWQIVHDEASAVATLKELAESIPERTGTAPRKTVVVMDEFLFLNFKYGKELTELMRRITRDGPTAGIYLVASTLKPTEISPAILDAFATRASFQLRAGHPEATVLMGNEDATKLEAHGEMIFAPAGGAQVRVRVPHMPDQEIRDTVTDLCKKYKTLGGTKIIDTRADDIIE